MNLLKEIRLAPQAFRILRDEDMVFEFEFDSMFSFLPNTTGRQEVVVFVSCPLAVDDILLAGCDVRIHRKSDYGVLSAPASWQEDKEKLKLRGLIEVIAIAFKNNEKPIEEQRENPQVELAKERLERIAAEAARIIMEDRGLDFHDLLSIHTAFSLSVVDQMFELYQKDHA
jgi:hypothetical protein